ncbi:hypothetical protein [Halalkalibacter sp. APA_J-10(15)]|uniref:hypothetical protein n=1 Tax=Halalkalibacter sp. APA_J-10(15) TaxID=2933805 RepID=UPI001FF68144|nr:hypothetical protein [Halalkalibacter sp. APA_J-10(15)]MCK0470897.1 hypothetical protein [Halalkalibacter sp. APA_J-10(15)]
MNYKNKVATALFYIGIGQMIAGLIIGFVVAGENIGTYAVRYEISWGLFLLILVSCFIAGMILIGFAELIEKQHENNNLLTKLIVSTNGEVEIAASRESVISIDNKEDRQEDMEANELTNIHEYFKERNKVVDDVIATPSNHKYLVKSLGETYLVQTDGVYSNKVTKLKLSSYPSIEKWMKENEM